MQKVRRQRQPCSHLPLLLVRRGVHALLQSSFGLSTVPSRYWFTLVHVCSFVVEGGSPLFRQGRRPCPTPRRPRSKRGTGLSPCSVGLSRPLPSSRRNHTTCLRSPLLTGSPLIPRLTGTEMVHFPASGLSLSQGSARVCRGSSHWGERVRRLCLPLSSRRVDAHQT